MFYSIEHQWWSIYIKAILKVSFQCFDLLFQSFCEIQPVYWAGVTALSGFIPPTRKCKGGKGELGKEGKGKGKENEREGGFCFRTRANAKQFYAKQC